MQLLQTCGGGTTSNLFKTFMEVRGYCISRVNCYISLGSELMSLIFMLELAEYLMKIGQEMYLKCDVVWLLALNGICQ